MKDLSKVLLKLTDSLNTAIQALHISGERIVLVVDDNMHLLGTVTDGDIRRALIKNTAMDCTIEGIMNSEPYVMLASESPDSIMSKMKNKDILSIPLVDKKGMLVGLETLHHLLENKKYDNPVFLMAGGFGIRLHPLTKTMPKPLLNVGNRPILETIINQFVDAGFHDFYISVHYKADMIRDYFGDGSNWGVTFQYLDEDIPLGTAGSLGLLPNNMPELPIIMMNGDILTKVNFKHLLNFHYEQGGLATMCIRKYDLQVPYGVVNIEGRYVTSIIEKPTQQFFVNAGIYVLNPKIINCIDGVSHIDMPNLLEVQIEQGEDISVFQIHEYWLDIGRMDEYKQAHKHYDREF